MPYSVLDLFDNKTVLDYLDNREYQPIAPEITELFPEEKIETLDFDILKAGTKIPVIASVHAFDTEAEIGEREGGTSAGEVALVKRKMQIKEKDLIALTNPRTSQEQGYVMSRVFNDIDTLIRAVRTRGVKMLADVLTTGILEIDENNLKLTIDYSVPENHKEILAGTKTWDDTKADVFGDIEKWLDKVGSAGKILTSRKVVRYMMKSLAKVYPQIMGTRAELSSFMEANGYPSIVTVEGTYRKLLNSGKYVEKRFFSEDKFILVPSGNLGNLIYGPTPEERKMITGNEDIQAAGNILAMVYEEGVDPVATWIKAVATMLPSFPEADNIFQATVFKGQNEEGTSGEDDKE